MRFLLSTALNALALWLTTLIVAGHINVKPFGEETWQVVLSYVIVALIFGIVNTVIGTVIRVLAFPLYILTLGLISFIINGLLLWIVHWLSTLFGWGLVIDGGFWWGVLGAFVLGVISWILGMIFHRVLKKEGRDHR